METKYNKNRFKAKGYNKKLNNENKTSHLPLQMMLSITSRRTNNKNNNNKTTIPNKKPPEMHSFEILSVSSNSPHYYKENDLDLTFNQNECPVKISFDANDLLNNLRNDYSPEIDYYKPQNKHKYLPKIQPFIRTFRPKKQSREQKTEHESIIKNNGNNKAYLDDRDTEIFTFTSNNKSLNNIITSPLFSENNNEEDELISFSNQFSFMSDN